MAKSDIKFKESAAEAERIKAQIAQKSYSPVYLLMGEEPYFIDSISEMLSEQVLPEAEKTFNRTIVYGKDSTTGAIANLCRQMPMMGQRQVVIVREAQMLRKIEELTVYTSSPAKTTILVICHKEKNVDKRTAFYKSCLANGTVLESVRPRDYEIKSWLTDFIRKRSLDVEPKAVDMITEHIGTDISKISNELNKLVISLPEGTKKITAEHIEQNIGISKDFNNFELCKAVAVRDMRRALSIADNFARNPKQHPLVVTLSTLFVQFRQIFIINYYKWLTARRGQAMPSDMELCRTLKVSSPYIVGELKQAAALYPNKKTFKILGLMREYDAKSKGINNGSMSDGELLRELLLKIFLA